MDENIVRIIKAREALPKSEIPVWLLMAAQESDAVDLEKRHNGSLYPQIIEAIQKDPQAPRNAFFKRMRELAEKSELMEVFQTQSLTENDGVVVPETISTQEEERSCAVANMTTFLTCLTDEPEINEHQLSSALIHTGKATESKIARNQRDYDYHDFLKLLQTPSFLEHYPDLEFHAQEFLGCTFDDLAKMMYEMDGDDYDNEHACFIVCSVESTFVPNTLHEIILTKVENGQVTYHDPEKPLRGGGISKTLPIADFIKRWAVGIFGGYIVGVKEKQQTKTNTAP